MQIQSSLTAKESRTSILADGTLIVCAVGALLALILVLDACEYAIVPRASRLNGREKTRSPQQMMFDTNEQKTV
jgi:hypothetical protein